MTLGSNLIFNIFFLCRQKILSKSIQHKMTLPNWPPGSRHIQLLGSTLLANCSRLEANSRGPKPRQNPWRRAFRCGPPFGILSGSQLITSGCWSLLRFATFLSPTVNFVTARSYFSSQPGVCFSGFLLTKKKEKKKRHTRTRTVFRGRRHGIVSVAQWHHKNHLN